MTLRTYDDVSAAFNSGSVLSADQQELEQLLLAIARARILDPANQATASQRGETIRQLLAVRHSQRAHLQALWVAGAALFVSLASFAVSVYQLWFQIVPKQ